MKNSKFWKIVLFLIIFSSIFVSCLSSDNWQSFYMNVSLKNYPGIENYSIDDTVIIINFGPTTFPESLLHVAIEKINDNEIYGSAEYSAIDFEAINFYLFISEHLKRRVSKESLLFKKGHSYWVEAKWNEDESINIIRDDIRFFGKTFWNWYLTGYFKVDITNIDASLPFSQTFRLLLSDNNNADNTNIKIFNITNGYLYVYGGVKVGEDYESAQYYIKMEEYNSTSEQYELTKISKEKIISIVEGDPNEYNTIVDWNGGSPIITEDDFKLFDDTAWNVVQ